MKLCHTLVCFFFLSLQGGSPGLVNAEGHRIYKTEGANITVKCFFTFSGSRKYFCKQKCEDLILVNTTADSAENGRYSIEYRKKYWLSHPVLLVNITQLTKSDSGWYRCGLDKSWIQNSYKDFEIIVTNASDTSEPDWTLTPLTSFTPLSTSPETTTQSGLQQTESKKRSRRLLSVGVALAVKMVLLSLAVLFFRCRRRASKPKEPPVETQNASVSETNREDEDIGEDRQSRPPPPVETSSIYAYVDYSKLNGAGTTDDHSLIDLNCPTAAGSQLKAAADDSSELSYSVVEISRVSTTSLNRTTRANANDGIYSVLQLKANSDASHEDASSPLYSTVTFPLQ